jgi:hypothetical protein
MGVKRRSATRNSANCPRPRRRARGGDGQRGWRFKCICGGRESSAKLRFGHDPFSQSHATATASISTRPPSGNAATCTAERAGGPSGKNSA